MKYAGGDIVGLLIFVGVLIFQAVSHFVNSAKEAKKNQNKPSSPQRPAPAQPKPYNPDDDLDPFDDLLEALGKKPGQTPPQLPQPPPQRLPTKPLPPLTPVYQERRVVTPAKPAPPKQEPVQPPASLSQSAPSMVMDNDTARVQAALAKIEHQPVFETQIGKEKSLSQRAAESIEKAGGGQSAATVQHRSQTVSQDLTLHELVNRLRNPAEIRRAIVLKEIISTPVALR